MNTENIILTLIITISAIYLIRKVILTITSKEPSKCSGCCNSSCTSRQSSPEETKEKKDCK